MPLMRTDPVSGRSMPMMSFIAVDFPEPFGPISPRISPARIENDMSFTATRPPYRLLIPLTSRDPCSAMSDVLPGARQQAKKAVRKQQNHNERHREDHEIRQIPE